MHRTNNHIKLFLIASPQGTTIAGLKRLEELALRGGIINTFLAAYDRAKNTLFILKEPLRPYPTTNG